MELTLTDFDQLRRASDADRANALAELGDVTYRHDFIAASDVVSQGFRAHQVASELAVCSLPVAGNAQYLGVLNGGAAALLGETCGSIAATLAAPQSEIAVGVEISVHHLRPVRQDRVYCFAQLEAQTRSRAVYNLTFYRSDGVLSAIGTHTCAFVTAR